MKDWRNYWHPVWIGTAIYCIIRLVNDSATQDPFWGKPWQTNLAEWAGGIFVSFCIYHGIRLFIRRFNKEREIKNSRQQIFYEMGIVLLYTFVIINTLSLPMYQLDNGMQLHDPIILNVICLPLTMVGFIYVRANYYIQAFVEERIEREHLAREKVEAELRYLRAQINPHSLFNAINGIYFLISENPAASQRALEQLSEMLRYQLYDCNADVVPLQRELDYLQNYVHIQKLRKSERLQIQSEWPQETKQLKIAPFLLIPLLENAFKYVGGAQQIVLDARICEQSTFIFEVKNSVAAELEEYKSGGIGLTNLSRRLELLYPEQHQLELESNEVEFCARLRLNLR